MAESTNDTRQLTILVNGKDATGNVFKNVADKAKRELGRLDDLKDVLGEDSPFGKAMKTLGGAGALAGLSAIPTAMKEIKEAGAAIHEALTGDNAYFAEMEEHAKKTNDYITARRSLMEKERDIARETADLFAEQRGERELIGLTGAAREDVIRAQQDAKATKTLLDKRAGQRAGSVKAYDDQITSMSQAIEALRTAPLTDSVGASPGVGAAGDMTEFRRAEARRAAEIKQLEKQLGGLAGDRSAALRRYDLDTGAAVSNQRVTQSQRDEQIIRDRGRSDREKREKEAEEERRRNAEAVRDDIKQREEQERRARIAASDYLTRKAEQGADLVAAMSNPFALGGVRGAAARVMETESPDVVKAIEELGRKIAERQPLIYSGGR